MIQGELTSVAPIGAVAEVAKCEGEVEPLPVAGELADTDLPIGEIDTPRMRGDVQ